MLKNPRILTSTTTTSRQGGGGAAARLRKRATDKKQKKKKNGNNTVSDAETSDSDINNSTLSIRPPPSLLQAVGTDPRSSSLRTLLNDARDVMENLKALFGLLNGGNKQKTTAAAAGGCVPDEFPEYFNKVFDRTCCTSLTQSIRYPTNEGVEEMDYDDLYIDFVLNFQSAFKATIKEVILFRPPQVIKYTIRLVNDDTDVTCTSLAYIGGNHGKIIRTELQETHYSISPLINGLKCYFAIFTGEMRPFADDKVSTIDELRTRFNAIYHQSLTVIEKTSDATRSSLLTSTDAASSPASTTARTMDYNKAYASAVRLLENGAKIDLLAVHVHPDGLEYAIRYSLAGGIQLFVEQCLASVENGRIVRITTSSPEDTDTDQITGLLGPAMIQAMNNVKNLLALFFHGKNKAPYDFPRQFACTFEKSVEFIQADVSSVVTTTRPASSSSNELYDAFLQFAILQQKVDIVSMERVSQRSIAFTIHHYNQEMDCTTRFVANVGKNGKLERIAQQEATKYFIFTLIKNFRVFMSLFTGVDTQKRQQQQQHAHGQDQDQNAVLEERLNAICDRSIVIETSRGCVGYEQLLKTVLPSWLEKGRKTTLLQLKRHENGGLEYTLRHSTATHEVTTRSIALVERGKIVRVVPQRNNDDQHGDGHGNHHDQDYEFVYHNAKPINSITVEDRNNVIQKMQVYYGLFSRSATAGGGAQDGIKDKRKRKDRLLAAMVDLFDPLCFELTTTNGPVCYEWFKKCEVQKYVRGCLSMDWRVIHAQHAKGILYELCFLNENDKEKKNQKVRVLAILRGGKIIRLEAIENADYYNQLYPQSRPCLV